MKNYWTQIFVNPQSTIQDILDNNPNYASRFLYFAYGLFFVASFSRSTFDELTKSIIDASIGKGNLEIFVFMPSYVSSLLVGLLLSVPAGWVTVRLAAWVYVGLARLVRSTVSYQTSLTAILWGAYAVLPSSVLAIACNLYYAHEWSLTFSFASILFYLLGIYGVVLFIIMFKQASKLESSNGYAIGTIGVILETAVAYLINYLFLFILGICITAYALSTKGV